MSRQGNHECSECGARYSLIVVKDPEAEGAPAAFCPFCKSVIADEAE